jgi:hypothetical protein
VFHKSGAGGGGGGGGGGDRVVILELRDTNPVGRGGIPFVSTGIVNFFMMASHLELESKQA